MLPPTGLRSGQASVNTSGNVPAKRLLSNTGARRCVRGELLTNGYKSLRAQGMLRAVKVNEEEGAAAAGSTMINRNSAVKQSKELEHVNICIEKTPAEVAVETDE